jgi:SAM-dependent methyltransferase
VCGKDGYLALDLGVQPLANNLIANPDKHEVHYPLKFYWCHDCQYGFVNDAVIGGEVFDGNYPYYSSISKSYVQQCKDWAESYRKIHDPKSVLEIGCNDGYMLDNFKDLDHLGFEPSSGPAKAALTKGIHVDQRFFGSSCSDVGEFDLIIANNVFAHTPQLIDMARGMADRLNDKGTIVIEFPLVDNLIFYHDFDTIYHEHYSYFSILAIQKIFNRFAVSLVNWYLIPSHGGSARVYLQKLSPGIPEPKQRRDIESFSLEVKDFKLKELARLIELKQNGLKLALFGAAAKGNTFLNYLGIKNDIFDFCVDETPAKIGKLLPGSRIPIVGLEELSKQKPDILYILPWNFKDDIIKKTEFIKGWGGRHIWKQCSRI